MTKQQSPMAHPIFSLFVRRRKNRFSKKRVFSSFNHNTSEKNNNSLILQKMCCCFTSQDKSLKQLNSLREVIKTLFKPKSSS
jgi:hypothetical protein